MSAQDRSKILLTMVVVLVVINMATIVFMWAHRPERREQHGGERPANFLMDAVGFTEEQREAYRELIQEHQQGMRSLNDSIRYYKKQTFSNLSGTDSLAAIAAARKVAHIQERLEMKTFNHFVNVRALCTEDQKPKFDAVINDVLRMMSPQPPPPPGRR